MATDGLGCIDPDGTRPANFPMQGTTCHGDNGILVSVTQYFLLYKFNKLTQEDKERFINTCFALRFKEGVYLRNPMRRLPTGEIEFRNSKDNYDAMVIGGIIFDTPAFAEDILRHHNSDVFLTPKQHALFKVAIRKPVNIVELLFFCGAMIFNATQGGGRGSEGILNYLRCEAVSIEYERQKTNRLWIMVMACKIRESIINFRFKSHLIFFEGWYKVKHHPNLLLARELFNDLSKVQS